jgi:hypothetical protein
MGHTQQLPSDLRPLRSSRAWTWSIILIGAVAIIAFVLLALVLLVDWSLSRAL